MRGALFFPRLRSELPHTSWVGTDPNLRPEQERISHTQGAQFCSNCRTLRTSRRSGRAGKCRLWDTATLLGRLPRRMYNRAFVVINTTKRFDVWDRSVVLIRLIRVTCFHNNISLFCSIKWLPDFSPAVALRCDGQLIRDNALAALTTHVWCQICRRDQCPALRFSSEKRNHLSRGSYNSGSLVSGALPNRGATGSLGGVGHEVGSFRAGRFVHGRMSCRLSRGSGICRHSSRECRHHSRLPHPGETDRSIRSHFDSRCWFGIRIAVRWREDRDRGVLVA